MIRPEACESWPRTPRPGAGASPYEAPPWERQGELAALAFAVLWTSGPDPAVDVAFRMQALRRNPESGAWEAFDSYCAAPASARTAREFGVTSSHLGGEPPAAQVFADLSEFLRGRTVVVPSRTSFAIWARALASLEEPACQPVDLATLARISMPGRLAAEGEELPGLLLERRAAGARRAALGPAELRTALGVLIGRVLAGGEAALALLASGHLALWRDLRGPHAQAARELAFCLRLCEHPSVWRGLGDSLYREHEALTDGRLSDALRAYDTLEHALGGARPRWEREAEEHRDDSLGVVGSDPVTLNAADRRLVDEIFQEHLPRHFANGTDTAAQPSYRQGQHEVAARIAERFGEHELFLMHAPTGTGKTLAYLVPTMLWAFRQKIRVGIATYTRALQEQAMEKEVPLARALLKRVGLGAGLRVSVLKGRQNYVCWRALRLQQPDDADGLEERLAWTMLALFALSDPDGDLDRFSTRAPLGGLDARRWQRAITTMLRQVRAETGCCSTPGDRASCAAEVARRRAERSHVVITNHAFALSRREFFRHLVFDECEHLHDVAHDAFSHAVGLRSLAGLFERLHDRSQGHGTPAGRPLDRVLALAVPGSGAATHALAATDALTAARQGLQRVQLRLAGFKDWRQEQLSTRQDADVHSLFREYAASSEAHDLLEMHVVLGRAMNELAIQLAQVAEHLDALKVRGLARIRRALEVLRGELGERLAGVEAWIPRREDARPVFRREMFYDLETAANGEDVLVARVLLPNEVLGRHYLPDLRGAVFLSATTWLKGGFETSETYLGLRRAACPEEDEEREPSVVVSYRAPDAFDYGRVLVAVPKDAPSITGNKSGFLAYVRRFVAHLTERTRGRCLVLFTNADDLTSVGSELEGFFEERRLPFWYQRMQGTSKEELSELFRTHTDSVLFGLDTFWYGADFPGPTCEYLVIVRLPYGVPDRYHQAQCAVLGNAEQRRQIYMPRALSKFRQGFGRLMRKETDRGCVFFLDNRILDPRHRVFLKELPVQSPFADDGGTGARLVVASTDRCLDAAFAHMEMKADIHRRGLDRPFGA